MRSSLLSDFWNKPVSIVAHVLLPDSYYKDPQRRYPVLYWIQGFDGTGDIDVLDEENWQRPMRAIHSEFIIVFLNGMFNGGHTEFADSANDGPWGAALTSEFIPDTDAYFRTIPNSAHRFVGGHSSGGWSALWLQVTYPSLFGAEWSVSPDPVDFKDFCGVDLTRVPPQNFYHDDAGHTYRCGFGTLREFVDDWRWGRRQFESFNAVFSPRRKDGTPAPLFDKHTGVIDPHVEQYWESHFDIAQLMQTHWNTLGPQLRGKLHIIVGTHDQFLLQRPVELLERILQHLGSDAEFNYVPGANHFTVFGFHGNIRGYVIRQAAAITGKNAGTP